MPDDLRWTRIESLFDGALDRPAADRAAWLDAECAGDAMLRTEVQRMLDAHGRPGLLDFALPRPRSLADRLARALAGRYAIEEEIGAGGMATVFLAREEKHDRSVVIKVLNPDLAAWWGGERFFREIRIVARLSHPHIVGLIDSGDADGLLYYVMPFVEAETLRARLDRAGALPVADALILMKDIASALAYAHAAGVVHRDLKPGNVLCSGDHAYLMDFGVAKLLEPITGGEQLTGMGVAIGTPAYMAPEQVRGEAIDHRADLFAWGLLSYEMLTGRLPNPDQLSTHGARETRPVRRPGVPREIVELIEQCLATEPRMRPDGAELLVDRLLRISGATTLVPADGRSSVARRRAIAVFAGLGLVVAMSAGLAIWRASSAGPQQAFGVPSPVAVTALSNETGDPALDFWGRMAGDWITQGLQETGLVSVVPWPTALQAGERAVAARAEGRTANPISVLRAETGAGTVVTGAYYLIGDSLQFRVEVVDARAGRLLGAPPSVVALRDSAHLAIRTLRDRLMGSVAIWSDERFARLPGIDRRPPRFDAYQAFDRALQRYASQDYRGAAPELRQAYALDTTFLVPLVHAAAAYMNTRELARADTVLRVLRARSGELSDYHRDVAESLDAQLAGDGTRAVAALRRAAAGAPGSRAWYNLALALIAVDQPAEALAALESLDPERGDMRGWSSYWTQYTHALHLLGQHERELAGARALRTSYPDRRVAIVLEARALAALGRTIELDSLLESVRSLPPSTYWSQGAAMVVAGEELLAHGNPDAARSYLERGALWLREQLTVEPTLVGHRYWMGTAMYDLGRWAEAGRWFEGLARDDPEDLQWRGLAALAAARLGDRGAERRLGEPRQREAGEHAAFRARLAAIRDEPTRAASLFADGVRHGIGGLAWLHASAHHELVLLQPVRASLPVSLRMSRGAPAPSVVIP